MTKKLLTVDEFRASAKNGARPEGTVIHLSVSDPEAAADGSRKIRFAMAPSIAWATASTPRVGKPKTSSTIQ